MPIYNDRKYIGPAIESLLAQSYGNFELILSDDCSTDGSAEICKSYLPRDARVKYVRQEKNIGISKNMKFLLAAATGKYFMWAANDDLWHKDFVLTLKNNLDNHPEAISSFCAYSQIDDVGNILLHREKIVEDFNHPTAFGRLKNLIRRRSDGFGYGLFLRSAIIDVQFPTWWGVNRSCAYNNIYPTLCYYLSRGEYVIEKEKILWFNRIKPDTDINHKIPFADNFFKCYLAFVLRKFNLACYSLEAIFKGSDSPLLAIRLMPQLFYSWFWQPIKNPYRKFKIYSESGRVDIFI